MKDNSVRYLTTSFESFICFLKDLLVIWACFIFPQLIALAISIPKYQELRYIGSNFALILYTALIVLCFAYIKKKYSRNINVKLSKIDIINKCIIYFACTVFIIFIGENMQDICSKILVPILLMVFPTTYVSIDNELVRIHAREIAGGLFSKSYSQALSLWGVNILNFVMIFLQRKNRNTD